MRKNARFWILLFLCLTGAASQMLAEDVPVFCGKTCALWPKLCATATACMKVCQVPARVMKACRKSKVPVDTAIPDISFTKQQFCESICSQYPLMCAAMTYCTQSCHTDAENLKACIREGKPVDTARPRITG